MTDFKLVLFEFRIKPDLVVGNIFMQEVVAIKLKLEGGYQNSRPQTRNYHPEIQFYNKMKKNEKNPVLVQDGILMVNKRRKKCVEFGWQH
jgi:hypothetical protein